MRHVNEIVGENRDRTLNTNFYNSSTGVVDSERESQQNVAPETDDPGRPAGVGQDGRDEMNLVEFPLSGITDRFLDGRKTIVFADRVWDRDQRQFVARELAVSGSDRYGLPTAKDEDVLLACIQLSSQDGFRERDVRFSRYEMLKLLRWDDEGKNYRRLATALRRWKGVTVYSNRAFYDHAAKSWVNRDFGIFDNLTIYERERSPTNATVSRSQFVWNEVLFRSFQAGYVKRLNWDLYCRLTNPVAKRLYRLLDKRFYRSEEVVFDLHDLAFRRIRVSENYNSAQIKRALAHGISELETLWELRRMPPERRFVKRGRGKWDVVFQRIRPRRVRSLECQAGIAEADLSVELTRRDIGPATAADLVAKHPPEAVRTMIALFDWYRTQKKAKGPGFLVESIRRGYRLPAGFASAGTGQSRKQVPHSRKSPAMKFCERSPVGHCVDEKSRCEAFLTFWNGLTESAQRYFDAQALKHADSTKRDGYLRSLASGGQAFEQYRQLIRRDHFERARNPGGQFVAPAEAGATKSR